MKKVREQRTERWLTRKQLERALELLERSRRSSVEVLRVDRVHQLHDVTRLHLRVQQALLDGLVTLNIQLIKRVLLAVQGLRLRHLSQLILPHLLLLVLFTLLTIELFKWIDLDQRLCSILISFLILFLVVHDDVLR